MRIRAGERLLQPVASRRLSNWQLLRQPNYLFHHTHCSHATLLLIILIAVFLLLSVCFALLLLVLLLTSDQMKSLPSPSHLSNQSDKIFSSLQSNQTSYDSKRLQSLNSTTLFDQLIDLDDQTWTDQNLFNRLLDLRPSFRFILNPLNRCDSQTKFLLLVHSHVQHFNARNAIRTSWANQRLQQNSQTRLVFLVGQLQQPDDDQLDHRQRLDQEFVAHQDLVSGNFVDSYRNLTYKHLMGFNWALQFCSQTRFIVKSDDDAFIDLKRLIHMLQSDLLPAVAQTQLLQPPTVSKPMPMFLNNVYSNRDGRLTPVQQLKPQSVLVLQQKLRNLMRSASLSSSDSLNLSNDLLFMACSLFSNGTRTRRTGKWALTMTDYPDEYLPAYCSGLAYVLNISAARLLYLVAQITQQPPLHIDDLFVTGLTLQRLMKMLKKSDQLVMFDWSQLYAYDWRRLQRWTQQTEIIRSFPPMITDLGDCPDRSNLMRLAAAKLQL